MLVEVRLEVVYELSNGKKTFDLRFEEVKGQGQTNAWSQVSQKQYEKEKW